MSLIHSTMHPYMYSLIYTKWRTPKCIPSEALYLCRLWWCGFSFDVFDLRLHRWTKTITMLITRIMATTPDAAPTAIKAMSKRFPFLSRSSAEKKQWECGSLKWFLWKVCELQTDVEEKRQRKRIWISRYGLHCIWKLKVIITFDFRYL